MATALNMTAMGVRQHLYDLQRLGLVCFETEGTSKGRPAKLWRLTSEANRYYGDAHAELAVGLIDAVKQGFGADGLSVLLDVRRRQMAAKYRSKLSGIATVAQRVAELAKIRSEEGYMAVSALNDDGSIVFVENHCPICAAASICQGLCAIEIEVFQEVIGDSVEVTRTDHIQAGAQRCAYLFSPK